MLQSDTGSVGPLILFAGFACAAVAIISPKTGLYISAAGLLVAMPRLLEDDENLIKFLKFIILCFVPWAFMGFKQYFFGYAPMESFYAETFLSQVSS